MKKAILFTLICGIGSLAHAQQYSGEAHHMLDVTVTQQALQSGRASLDCSETGVSTLNLRVGPDGYQILYPLSFDDAAKCGEFQVALAASPSQALFIQFDGTRRMTEISAAGSVMAAKAGSGIYLCGSGGCRQN